MAPDPENRYTIYMVKTVKNRTVVISILTMFLLSSCASISSFMQSDEDGTAEVKEVSLDQRLQISIPLPENSKMATDRTVIFGGGDTFTGVLYLFHDISAEEVVNFYRKAMTADGWTELAIVRSKFILINFDREDRFATIKVNRNVFDNSASEITIGPKSRTTINRSLNIQNDMQIDDSEPFEIK